MCIWQAVRPIAFRRLKRDRVADLEAAARRGNAVDDDGPARADFGVRLRLVARRELQPGHARVRRRIDADDLHRFIFCQ